MSEDLASSVRDRLNQLEQLAQKATQGDWHRNPGWSTSPSIDAGKYDTAIGPGDVSCSRYCYGGSSRVELSGEDADHITTWDPPTVLTLVAGLRAVLDQHGPDPDNPRLCESCGCQDCAGVTCPCPTVRALASAVGIPAEGAGHE